MSRRWPFPVLGHGTMDPDGFLAWVIFRTPPPDRLLTAILAKAPPLLVFDPDNRAERMLGVHVEDGAVYEDEQAYGAMLAAFDGWLEVAHARHAIEMVVILDGDPDEPNDARDAWSTAQIEPVLLPWFASTWRFAPELRSRHALAVLAELVERLLSTRAPATIELAVRAIDRALADLGSERNADAAELLASHCATLLGRLPRAAARAALAELAPHLRFLVGSHATEAPLLPAADAAHRELDALLAHGPIDMLGAAVARLGETIGSPELQERSLALGGAPVETFLELASTLRGDALDRLIAAHFERYATDELTELLHRALSNDIAPLVARCLEAAAGRLDAPDLVANVLYATSRSGRAHESIRLAREFLPRYRRDHPGRMLATIYTNALLPYGATATCDDVSRMLTGELEQILAEDPGYFREDGAGGAGADILGSAYGAAACGRATMNDGAGAARWLEKARAEGWSELAVCSNLVCFQHLKDDPHVRPVVAAIARAEVARLEAELDDNDDGDDGDDVRPLFALALTLHNGGHLDDAERYYRRVLAIDPRHADTLNNLGNVHGTRGRYDEAIASYDAAIAEVPDHPLYHACRGWALARAARYREAIATCDRAVAIDPNQSSAYFPRGAAYLQLGERDRAAADFRRGAELNPAWRASEKDDPWFAEMAAILGA
ncbi:MAG: tetratricopeptide repeat protein [Deltaproteobacteria bacterium]|nr:tetratricopeptide repeat protein [Deltaproteobacteria bacterium]